MNEDELPTGPAGAPADPTKEQFDAAVSELDGGGEKKPKKEAKPQQPVSKLGQFFDYIKKSMSGPDPMSDAAQAAARGVVGAAPEMANAVVDVGSGALSAAGLQSKDDKAAIEEWEKTVVDKTDENIITPLFGKHQDGVLGTIETISKISTGAYLGTLVGGPALLTGSIGAAAATDPKEKRLSDMFTGTPLQNVVTDYLKSNADDSALTSRFKSTLENLMTGYAIEKTVRVVVAAKALFNAKTPAAIEAATAELEAAKNLPHDPATQGPVITEKTPDGQYAVVDNSKPKETPAAPDRRAAPREGSVDRRATERPDYTKMDRFRQIQEEQGLIHQQLRDVKQQEVFRRRGEPQAVLDVMEARIARVEQERVLLRSLIDGKTGPVYATEAEAEGVAASINNAVKNAEGTPGTLSKSGMQKVDEYTLRIQGTSLATWIHPDFDIYYGATGAVEHVPAFQEIADRLPKAAKTDLSVVQTHDETVDLANTLGIQPEEVIPRIKRLFNETVEGPEQVTATRMGLNSLSQKVSSLSRAADALGDNGAVAYNELKKALSNLWEMHGYLKGTSRNIGRTLNAHQIAVGSDAETTGLMRTAQKAGAPQNAIESMDKQQLTDLARLISMSDGRAEEVLNLMRSQAEEVKLKSIGDQKTLTGKAAVAWQKTRDFLLNWRMEAMLSAPVTHEGNAVSNTLAAVVRPVEYMITGLPGKMFGNPELFNEGADTLVGLITEQGEAWKGMSRAFMAGRNILDEAPSVVADAGLSAGVVPRNPFVAALARWVKPSNYLMAGDEYFKVLSARASVRAQSLRDIRKEGITDAGVAAKRMMDDMRASFTPEGRALNPRAVDYAREVTFQTPFHADSWYASIQRVVQKHPLGRVIMPFVRTPLRIYDWNLQRTPLLGLASRELRADLAAGGRQAQLAMGKQAVGVLFWSSAAAAATSGLVTGGGPNNPTLRKQWLAAGNQPYSVNIAGKQVSFRRLDPVFMPFGIVADLVQASSEMKEQDWTDHAGAMVTAFASNFVNKSFMQGVSSLLSALHGDVTAGAALIENTVGSFVPAIARSLNPDPLMHETRTMVDEVLGRLPGFSTHLEPRRNLMGEVMMRPPGIASYINHALNPLVTMDAPKDTDVLQQLVQLGRGMAMPKTTVGNLDITDRDKWDNGNKKHQSPYDRALELCNTAYDGQPKMRDDLIALMKSKDWKEASSGSSMEPGGLRWQLAANIVTSHQQRAWAKVALDINAEYPKLHTELLRQKLISRAALTGGQQAADSVAKLPPQFIQ
jgi:hypothetical protein